MNADEMFAVRYAELYTRSFSLDGMNHRDPTLLRKVKPLLIGLACRLVQKLYNRYNYCCIYLIFLGLQLLRN